MSTYIAPGKSINIQKSIDNDISYELLEKSNFSKQEMYELKKLYSDEKVFVWALGTNSNVKGYLNNFKEGDIIFILNTDQKLITHKLTFVKYIQNTYLNSNLWSKDKSIENEKWINILFLKYNDTEIEKYNISKKELSEITKAPGKEPYTFQTFYKLKDFQEDKLYKFIKSKEVVTIFKSYNDKLPEKSFINTEFEEQIKASKSLSREERKKRLSLASKKPEKFLCKNGFVFKRNPDVVAERLYIADGYCEQCKNPAPFNRSSDGSPYLEVHHKISLSKGGNDTVENTLALCPNCHRKIHFG